MPTMFIIIHDKLSCFSDDIDLCFYISAGLTEYIHTRLTEMAFWRKLEYLELLMIFSIPAFSFQLCHNVSVCESIFNGS